MGEWKRSTRACRLDSLAPEMAAAIQNHSEHYNLGSILAGCRMCIETLSEKKKKGLFGGGEQVLVTAIVTPHWLVWAVKDKAGVSALSAPLQQLAAVDYAHTPGYRLIPDRGIEVTGHITGRVGADGNERVSAFIGLGEEPEAQEFAAVLAKAIREARPGAAA